MWNCATIRGLVIGVETTISLRIYVVISLHLEDVSGFRNFVRMSESDFEMFAQKVAPKIERNAWIVAEPLALSNRCQQKRKSKQNRPVSEKTINRSCVLHVCTFIQRLPADVEKEILVHGLVFYLRLFPDFSWYNVRVSTADDRLSWLASDLNFLSRCSRIFHGTRVCKRVSVSVDQTPLLQLNFNDVHDGKIACLNIVAINRKELIK